MGYARQDRAFEPGEPVSARAMARAVSPGTDRVVLVNPHEESIADLFETHVTVCDAAGRLAEPLPDGLADPLFLSPDSGAIDLAEAVRATYGDGETDYFEKTRHSGTEVEITPSDADPSGRDVVIVDDIVATGSTMSEAVGHLDDGGAARVFATCVHPLLVRNARTRLERAGIERIIGTDTVERDVSVVSVAPSVAAAVDAVEAA
jgi:ribose-phosphate pyrophosphokinase